MRKLLSGLVLTLLLIQLVGCTEAEQAKYLTSQSGVTQSASSILVDGTMLKYVTHDELSNQEKQQINNEISNMIPDAKRIGEPSNKYNCHSYAWYLQSTSNTRWIDDPSPMWGSQGRYKVDLTVTNYTTLQRTAKGTKIVFFKGTIPWHSGIVKDATIVISKWGKLGLYEHKLGRCPYVLKNEVTSLSYMKLKG